MHLSFSRPFASSLIFALALTSAQALDLTPYRGVRQGNEGGLTAVVEFTDGRNKIDYRPPAGWQPSGGGKAVSFFSMDTVRAWMKLMLIPKEKESSSEEG